MQEPIITWGETQNGLAIALTGSNENIEVHLKNESSDTLKIWAYVQTYEIHYDWFTLKIKDKKNNEYKIILSDARDRSAPISKILNPQEDIVLNINLIEWINRAINQKKYPNLKLKGAYQLSITYEVKRPDKKWTGKIEVINHPIIIN